MGELNKSISGIRALMKDMKAEMYAIVNPDLIALDEYIKNLYLKVLCTIVQYENEPSEMQVLYLKRIIKGIEVDETLEEYMRKALEISDIDIKEFITFMKENQARYYFALEGMLLVAMGNSQHNMEYLAEIIELCGITKKDLEHLSLVASSVLQQESSYYDAAKNTISVGTRGINFYPYILNYYVGAVVDNDVEKYYSAPSLEMKCNIDFPTEYTARKVVFKNLSIELNANWYFTGCEKIEFINCRLSTKESAVINFKAIGNVTFTECEFGDFDNHIAYFDSVNEVAIMKTLFCNCGWTCDGDKRGGLFVVSNNNNNRKFTLEESKFQNCYIKAKQYRYNYGVTGILFEINWRTEYKIVNNEFIGCQCINNGNYIEAIFSGSKPEDIIFLDNRATGEVTRFFEYE